MNACIGWILSSADEQKNLFENIKVFMKRKAVRLDGSNFKSQLFSLLADSG